MRKSRKDLISNLPVVVYWLSVVDLLVWDAGTSVRRCASAAEFVADAVVAVVVVVVVVVAAAAAVGAVGAGASERLQPAACAATSAGPG